MKLRITALALLVSSIYFSQTLTTQTRINAGTATTESGFFQAENPQNFPPYASGWWGLIDLRHTDSRPDNNYAIQIAGSFFNQDLWFRKTDNNGARAWSKFVLEDPFNNVAIGKHLNVSGDIITGGENSWIIHTPDKITHPNEQPKTTLHIAPRKSDNSDWDWGKQTIFKDGNIAVNGKLEAREVKVTNSPSADFVFEENYNLPKLEEVEKHIKEKKHLPEIASAKEMEKEGVNVGEFQIKLLQKIEELTLYSIEQNKQIKVLLERIENLEKSTEKNKS